MFDVAVNYLHAYDVLSGTPLDHKHFRLKLAEQLIGNYHTRKCAGYPKTFSSSQQQQYPNWSISDSL